MKSTLLTIAISMLTAMWISTTPALATGTYQVRACNSVSQGANNSWAWSTDDAAEPPHYAEHTRCPYLLGGTNEKADQEGGLSTTDALGLSSGAMPGTSASWKFVAPEDTSIEDLEYERYIGHDFDPDNYWSPALRADGTIVPGQTCLDTVEDSEKCSVGGPPGTGVQPAKITGLSAHELSIGIACQAPSEQECVTGATQYAAWTAVYGATVTLSDPNPPKLNAPSGPLWQPGQANGYHKGNENVTVSAQDAGGGVANITLLVDGQPTDTYEASCDFTFPQPCPSSTGTQTLNLPTTQLADGKHSLSLVATDAAGNQSISATKEILVDNNPPPPPVDLSATATGSSTFTLAWSNPPVNAAPITSALYQVCPVSGSGACSAPAVAPAAGPTTVTVPGPGHWRIALWLTDAAGNGTSANAAQIEVTVPAPQPTGPGSKGDNNNKPKIHVKETLHGRTLVVHVSAPAKGKVRVSFVARLKGKIVAVGRRTVGLKRGRLTVVFRLGRRTAADALIRVSAQLGNEPAVTSTLRRRTSKRR